MLDYADLLKLKRWNTPTVYNGWESVTKKDRLDVRCNREEVKDFMPQMGSMAGYAVTVTFEPSNKDHFVNNEDKWHRYREYLVSVPGPKIVVVQDFDSPDKIIGSFWGEVCSNMHRALGCVGTVTDGAIRDVDEMTNAGFKALARRLCVGHAYSVPVAWGVPVEVYGCNVNPGDLIHADKHGFLVIPEDDQKFLVEAVVYMDTNECLTTISAARQGVGKPLDQVVLDLDQASARFAENKEAMQKRFQLK
ncbi:RraA family protein [Marispirochaeta sp.]|uniref:RraA family protein n=1 Tax=Marispirochaeta sp. TaxID=2038653 RepID=UPI0029C65139|nr:RraA family protein [Marispirochaeta sp.]